LCSGRTSGAALHIEGAPDTHNTESLIAIQILDGVDNAIFGVVSILVVTDRIRATGRFNLVQGSLATAVGLDAALSTHVRRQADSALQQSHLFPLSEPSPHLHFSYFGRPFPRLYQSATNRVATIESRFVTAPGIKRRLLASINQALDFSRETLQRTSGLCLAEVCTSTSLCCIESDFHHAWL
jgi:hypothetical protein